MQDHKFTEIDGTSDFCVFEDSHKQSFIEPENPEERNSDKSVKPGILWSSEPMRAAAESSKFEDPKHDSDMMNEQSEMPNEEDFEPDMPGETWK